MATRKAQQQKSNHPLIIIAGFALALVAEWFGYPGVVLAVVGMVATGITEPPVELTGTKFQGRAQPLDESEDEKMLRYRMVSAFKTSPFVGLIPTWPPLLVWFAALGMAGITWYFPAAVPQAKNQDPVVWHALNALAAAMVVVGFEQRHRAVRQSPGVRVTDVLANRVPGAIASVIGVVMGFVLGNVVLPFTANFPALVAKEIIFPSMSPLLICSSILLCWAVVCLITVRGHALAKWRAIEAENKVWLPRWRSINQRPEPRLIDTETVGPFLVDTFQSPGLSTDILKTGETKITPTIGAGYRVGYLPSPNVDSNGQPIPATVHPNRFVVAQSSIDEFPDLFNEDVPDDVRMLGSRVEWQPRWKQIKVDPAPEVLESRLLPGVRVDAMVAPPNLGAAAMPAYTKKIAPMVGSEAKAAILSVVENGEPNPTHFRVVQWKVMPDISNPDIDQELLRLRLDSEFLWQMAVACAPYPTPVVSDIMLVSKPGMPALWSMTLVGGLPLAMMEAQGWGASVANVLGVESLIDTENGCLYLGTLSSAVNEIADEIATIELNSRWAKIWLDALPEGRLPPEFQYRIHDTLQLSNGQSVHRYAFAPLKGLDPMEFIKFEPKLKTSLTPAPFLTMAGFQDQRSRIGERHPQLFTVYHSEKAVPVSPDKLAASENGRGELSRYDSAAKWVLIGMVNDAFAAAKTLARPEVVKVRNLTTPKSRNNIWEVKVRLYGGNTLADVRSRMENMRSRLACPWLRVAEGGDGCVMLYMGANPKDVELANPRKDQMLIDNLEWTQAFISSGVTSRAGLLPALVSSSHLPANEQVQEMTFSMPDGLSLVDIRDKVDRLKSAIGCEFVSPTPVKGEAKMIRILCSKSDPMPTFVEYDYDTVVADKAIPFGQSVEGTPVIYDWKTSPHMLIAGGSGSGKAGTANTPVRVPFSAKFPTGWALWEQLEVGDSLFTPDGGTTTVTKVYEWIEDHPVFLLSTDDGQSVEVGANHLFMASSAASRKTRSKYAKRRRDDFASTEQRKSWSDLADRLDRLVEETDPTLGLPVADIERLAGVPAGTVDRLNLGHLAEPHVAPVTRPLRTYDAKAVWEHLSQREVSTGKAATLGGAPIPFGGLGDLSDLWAHSDGWLTARQIGDVLMGRRATRSEVDGVKSLASHSGIESRTDGSCTTTVWKLPVREVLARLRDDYREAADLGRNRPGHKPLLGIHRVKDMARAIKTENSCAEHNFALPLPQALDLPEADLPVDPWLIGAWLGDGPTATGSVRVGSADVDSMVPQLRDSWNGPLNESFTRSGGFWVIKPVGLTGALREAGVLGRKHIPVLYQNASISQRLALLQGLMDTDGTVDSNGSCGLSLSDETLANDALSLIRGLGIKASKTVAPSSAGGEERHCIHFTTTQPVFRVQRKFDRLPTEVRDAQQWLYVTSIESAGYARARCITVDSPAGEHIVGDMLPTHNSATLQVLMTGAIVRGAEVLVGDPMKGAADFKFAEPWCRTITTTIEDTAAMMRGVYKEVERRRDLNSLHGVGSYRDLPDDVRPRHMVVIIDEFTSLIQVDKSVPRTPFDDDEMEAKRQLDIMLNNERRAIGQIVGNIAREARSAGVTMWLGAQKLTAQLLDSIPGGDSLKINMARMILGMTTYSERASALRLPDFAPDLGTDVPIGRGLFESSISAAVALQTYYTGSDNLVAFLQKQQCELAVPFDIEPYRSKKQQVGSVARVVHVEDPFSVEEKLVVAEAFVPTSSGSSDGGFDLSHLVTDDDPDDLPEAVEAPAPVVETPMFGEAVEAPAPVVETPMFGEAVEAPAPVVETPMFGEAVEAPAPVVETPMFGEAVEAPAPVVETPMFGEAVEAPAPVVETPMFGEAVEAPAPVVETPMFGEAVEAPAPVVETPMFGEAVEAPDDLPDPDGGSDGEPASTPMFGEAVEAPAAETDPFSPDLEIELEPWDEIVVEPQERQETPAVEAPQLEPAPVADIELEPWDDDPSTTRTPAFGTWTPAEPSHDSSDEPSAPTPAFGTWTPPPAPKAPDKNASTTDNPFGTWTPPPAPKKVPAPKAPAKKASTTDNPFGAWTPPPTKK